jgi:hypothetical protein
MSGDEKAEERDDDDDDDEEQEEEEEERWRLKLKLSGFRPQANYTETGRHSSPTSGGRSVVKRGRLV